MAGNGASGYPAPVDFISKCSTDLSLADPSSGVARSTDLNSFKIQNPKSVWSRAKGLSSKRFNHLNMQISPAVPPRSILPRFLILVLDHVANPTLREEGCVPQSFKYNNCSRFGHGRSKVGIRRKPHGAQRQVLLTQDC